jgi:hypothetical protein
MSGCESIFSVSTHLVRAHLNWFDQTGASVAPSPAAQRNRTDASGPIYPWPAQIESRSHISTRLGRFLLIRFKLNNTHRRIRSDPSLAQIWSEVSAFEREGVVAEEAMEEVMHEVAKVTGGKMHAVAVRQAVEAVATASRAGTAAAKTGPLPVG